MKILFKETYLTFIKKSVGSRMFQTLWVEGNKDILEGGDLSCAFFVSNLLKIFNLITDGHATVRNTVKDLKESGWFEIEEPREGAVLVWDEIEFEDGFHKHIGFYIGNEKAVSNRSEKGTPMVHHYLYNEEDPREIKAILWNKRIDEGSF